MAATSYDTARRRKGVRTQRERGCWVYIAGEELERAGIDSHGPVPFYRIWAGKRGRFIVTCYGER